jgi:hypothetical protein
MGSYRSCRSITILAYLTGHCKIFQPNYKKLGLKKGLLHVYIRTGNIKEMAEKLLSGEGIMSAGIHVGNSDKVGEFVYEDSEQLVDLVSHVKKQDEVEARTRICKELIIVK